MNKPSIVRFDQAAQVRCFPKGRFEIIEIGGMTVGRAIYEPGWRWSEHLGRITGTASCQVEHIGLVISGRGKVRMDNGDEYELGPGDLFHIPRGHDGWVVGDEPYISIHLLGSADYATPRS